MGEARPLLSIVIPTRNRQRYALSAARALLSTMDDRIEVVVHDNSDTAELQPMIAPLLSDSRLRFVHLARTASPVENFDLAVQLARGEYVCAIGDDDVVNPDIVAACEWAAREDVDAIVTDRYRALYFWPDFTAADTGTRESGTLQIFEFSGRVEDVDPEAELRKCSLTAGVSLQRLPKVYLGIVRRRCLERMYEQVAGHQVGTCPDMYYGVAAASFTKRVVLFDYPLVVPGASAPSAAGAVRMRKHEGALATAPHFRARPDYRWLSQVPAFYSVNTFYAESALLAMQATGRDDHVRRFNLPFLYLLCALSYREFWPQIRASMDAARTSHGAGRTRFALSSMVKLMAVAKMLVGKRVSARSLRPGITPAQKTVRDLANSAEATQALIEYLQSRNVGARSFLTPQGARP